MEKREREYNPFKEEPRRYHLDGITYIIFEDKTGQEHIEQDYRVFEVDRENPLGHELREHRETQEPIE